MIQTLILIAGFVGAGSDLEDAIEFKLRSYRVTYDRQYFIGTKSGRALNYGASMRYSFLVGLH